MFRAADCIYRQISSAHFPKLLLHRSTRFHELRKVIRTSKIIDSSVKRPTGGIFGCDTSLGPRPTGCAHPYGKTISDPATSIAASAEAASDQ